LLPLLLPDPGLRLDRLEITPATITLTLRTTSPTASCPDCAQPTHQIHSRYTRHARDLPIHGCPVRLRLTARRFFCNNPDCPRRIFCEPLPLLLARHAQAARRLTDTQRHLGLALGSA
jgi:transposase